MKPPVLRRLPVLIPQVAALLLSIAPAAAAPVKDFRVFYPPLPVITGGVRLDDRGNILAITSFASGPHTSKTECYIYRPSREGNLIGLQTIPGPASPNQGQFGLVDINQKSQFVCSESSIFDVHRYVWNGAAFVELQDPRSLQNPAFLNRSMDVTPTSIHDDGSVWGMAKAFKVNGADDFGGIVSWTLGGTPAPHYAYVADDPLAVGLPRSESGQFLRFGFTQGLVTDAFYWDGLSGGHGTSISPPPSRSLRMNDLGQVVGIVAATREVWIYLPQAAYGLTAGFHLLPGVVAETRAEPFFTNAGQILVSAEAPTPGLKLWQKGEWNDVAVNDPDGTPLDVVLLQDGNATGSLLAYVRPLGQIVTAKLALLTPSSLGVTVEVTPRVVAVGADFDLQLDIRNNLDIPLQQVGIIVPSLFLTGDLIADWVKAPSALLTLAPGQSGTLHYGFRAKGVGKTRVNFQVQGLDNAGARAALTESFAAPEVTVTPELDLGLDAAKRDVDLDEEFDITVRLRNVSNGAINSLAFVPATLGVTGEGVVELVSGPLPPLAASLAAGGQQELKFRFRAKQAGTVTFDAVATGKRPDATAVSSAAATSPKVRLGILGDLMIKPAQDPDASFGLDDVYQKLPAGAQVRTNVVDPDLTAKFQFSIQNDSKSPRVYRLNAVETGPAAGWDVHYLFLSNDVSSQVRSLAGFELPELASADRLGLLVSMKMTNPVPVAPRRVVLALSSPVAPAETLDAVEAVAMLPDVNVRAIEVTQVVQDWNNSIPLVEGKQTLVRVFFQRVPGSDVPDTARARLRAFRGGTELTESPLASAERSADVQFGELILRFDMIDSLNFYLPAEWLSGDVTLKLQPLDFIAHYKEPAEPGGSPEDGVVVAHFRRVPDLPILYHRVAEVLKNGRTGYPSVADVQGVVRRSASMYPVRRLDWRLGFSPRITAELIPGIRELWRINAQVKADAAYLRCPSLQNCEMHQALLPYLVSREGVPGVDGGLADHIPANVSTAVLNGLSQALGTAPPHELAHTLGRPHPMPAGGSIVLINGLPNRRGACGEIADADAPDFPYFVTNGVKLRAVLGPLEEGLDNQVFGFDFSRREFLDSSLQSELMSYCSRDIWISKFTYEALLEGITTRFGVPGVAGPQSDPVPVEQLLIRGAINPEGDLVDLLPIRRILSADSQLMPGPATHRLEVLGPGGAVLAGYDFQPFFDVEDASLGTFFFVVPEPAGFEGIRLKHGNSIAAAYPASANAPTVRVLSPNGGENLDADEITIRWEAADADGGPLSFQVEYSSDGGTNWSALAVDWDQPELTIPRAQVAGTQSGLVRVHASDGVLSTADTSDAVFRVADNAPEVAILYPVDDSAVQGGERVQFDVTALDPEDGVLGDDRIQWSSSLDGGLGTGRSFDVSASALKPGLHEIRATATDSAGHAVTAAVRLTVRRYGPAQLGGLHWVQDGILGLELKGSPGSTNVIERSTDLVFWTPVLTRVNARSRESVELPAPGNAPVLFLRAVTQP